MPHPRRQQAEQCLNRHITPEMDSMLDAAVKKINRYGATDATV